MLNPSKSDPLLDPFLQNEILASQIAHIESFEPREAHLAEPRMPVHPQLRERLDKLGLEKLYTHQAQAYDAACSGKDVVVVTGTNSGKTLCYNLPAIQWSLSEPAARNTRLRAGDVLAAPPFAVGVGEASVPGLGTLVSRSAA